MLPIPFLNFIPKLYREDSKAIALANFMDNFIGNLKSDVLGLRRSYRLDEVDSYFLPEIAYFLDVRLLNSDSDVTKRRKIKNSIQTHRYRGTWMFSVKPELDAITGYDAQLLTAEFRNGDWILVSNETSLSEEKVASLGTDGTTQGLGLNLSGTGQEPNVPGNVYIDLHDGVNTPVLTMDQIDDIVRSVETDIIPAYYKIFIGYVNSGGVFIPYLSF